jgi:hypothetical protein
MPRRPQYFMMRVRRGGPLVPARLRWLDHAPDDPEDNRLDRGRLSIVTCADIAGLEVPPEEVTERLWNSDGGRPGIPPTHWKYPEPISEAEYRYQLQRLRWAARNRPTDPVLRPRRVVDPAGLPLPDFTRENPP